MRSTSKLLDDLWQLSQRGLQEAQFQDAAEKLIQGFLAASTQVSEPILGRSYEESLLTPGAPRTGRGFHADED